MSVQCRYCCKSPKSKSDNFPARKHSNSIIADLNERGPKIVISQHPRRASPLPIDAEIYKWRHLIENCVCKLKEFKRIAMRADKTDQASPQISISPQP